MENKTTTAAQQRASNKYHREKMRAVSIRLPAAKMDQFNQACAILGTNKNAVLKAAVNTAIAQAGIDSSEK